MNTVISLLVEPFQYGFMIRAFLGVSLIAALFGVIGTLIILKGIAFIADAIAHAGFGGLVLALIIGIPLQLGALFFGIATAVLLTGLVRKTDLRADTSLAILFTGAFSLGVLGLATQPTFAGDLSSFLVGSVLAIGPEDIYWIIGAVCLTTLLFKYTLGHLIYVCFDPTGAEIAGLPVTQLQLLLLCLIAVSVVVALQAVGVILVVALLITPPATASLFSRRLEHIMGLAVIFGLIPTWIGVYLSYYLYLPTGATIVAVATIQFVVALLVSKLWLKKMRQLPSSKEGLYGTHGH